ncbi:hypothetical protein A3K63_00160 [Candidatus Micrarchaeota archaeon RBG_16_49_10]|nr:MAG: hypothetical protein A3K63_00160 [Candidatus Micrarchaeota archaeon RBG_16_49_10]
MKIVNVTKDRVVSENVIYRKSIRELVFGLIPYRYKEGNWLNFLKPKSFGEEDAMIFKVRGKESIHTIFMSFPISVFIMDGDMHVTQKTRLNPFEVFVPKGEFSYFLEMVDSKFDEIDVDDRLKILK